MVANNTTAIVHKRTQTGAGPGSTLGGVTAVATELAPRAYADDEALLSGIFDEVICAVEGPAALQLHREAIELGERSRNGDAAAAEQLAQLVAHLELPRIVLLIRML